MNAAHLHLLLNHFPLIGFVFSFFILALGLLRSNESYVRVGLLTIVVSGLLAVPTYLAGEPAEEIIEKLPGFSEQLVEAHEEAAEIAIWFIGITTLTAGAALWISNKKTVTYRVILRSVLVLNSISLVLTGRTSNLGGKISHPEVRGVTDQNVILNEDSD